MGIYSDGKIYGVSLKLDEEFIFNKTHTDEMTYLQIQELKGIYEMLSYDKRYATNIMFYMSCSSTYNISKTSPFMSWIPGNIALLENLFERLTV